jgi:hypothetical protein
MLYTIPAPSETIADEAQCLTDAFDSCHARLDKIERIISGQHIQPEANALLNTCNGRKHFEDILSDLDFSLDATHCFENAVASDLINVIRTHTIHGASNAERRLLRFVCNAIGAILNDAEERATL